jgi:hypothetical protein
MVPLAIHGYIYWFLLNFLDVVLILKFCLVKIQWFVLFLFDCGYFLTVSNLYFFSRAFQRFAVKTNRTLENLSSKGSIHSHCRTLSL